MNGPPLVVFGTLRRWTPGRFRATLQGYFFPASVMVMCGFWIAGLWTAAVNRYYVLSLAPVLGAIFLGHAINRRMKAQRFRVYINAVLVLVGLILFVQAVRR